MKRLLLLSFTLLSLVGFAETYYTCSTSGQNTTNPDGTTGCAASTAWNTAGDTLIVRNGTTFNIGNGATIAGNIIVEQGGTLSFGAIVKW